MSNQKLKKVKLPDGWEIKKLGDICRVKPPKKEAKDKLSDDDWVSFFPMADLKAFNHNINPQQVKTLKEVYKGYVYFEDKDVLLAKITPCFENGKIGIACGLKNGIGFGSSEYMVLRPNEDISSEYIYYFLSLDKIRIEGCKVMTGAVGHRRVPVEYIESQELLVPPLSEQERIVGILDEAFEAIDKAKENAEQNLKNANELFQSKLQAIFDEGKSKVQTGEWEAKRLGDVLLKTETVNPQLTPDAEFVYLDVSCVNKETKKIDSTVSLLGKDAPSRARKLVKTGDVIFATVRPTHCRVAIIPERLNNQVCSTGYYVLRPKEMLNNNFVYYFILTDEYYERMEELQKGASYPAVTNKEVESVIISFPKSVIEQKQIVQQLDKLSSETKKLELIYQHKLDNLQELKKSILQKAFNGEL